MNILVIEDEVKTADALRLGLKESGYAVDVVYDGVKGLALAQKNAYQLIISDIMMPGMNGINLCTKLRALQITIPVLLLTALESKEDVVRGLDAGADDYLTKPFNFSELLARIRNLTKRIDRTVIAVSKLQFADVEMDLISKEVFRSGELIELTVREFKLLEYFMRRPNTVVSRDELMRDVWKIDFNTGTNVVEVYINYLRNKIDKPYQNKLIHNIHGVGYTLKG